MKINKPGILITRSGHKTAWRLLAAIFILGLLAPVITNNKPLYVHYKGEKLFPVFHSRQMDRSDDVYARLSLYSTDWKTLPADEIIFPPFTYSDDDLDYMNADYVSPFEKQKFKNAYGEVIEMPLRYRHWLGTGKKGEDVLAVLFYGARYTFTIAFAAVAIAACIGLLLGILSGYYGNYHFKTTYASAFMFIAGLPAGYFYSFYLRRFIITQGFAVSLATGIFQVLISLIIFLITLIIFCYAGHLISKLLKLRPRIFIPLDSIISKFIEIFVSVPALIIIISLTALMKPSLLTIILVIGFTGWTVIARLVRAELLKIRNLEYVESARALGYGNFYIITRHALPNISSALFVTIVYTMAATIILESSLSFLGIGIPHDVITWGQLLSQSKDNFSAWWISLFPGGMIFLSLYCLNTIAKNIRK